MTKTKCKIKGCDDKVIYIDTISLEIERKQTEIPLVSLCIKHLKYRKQILRHIEDRIREKVKSNKDMITM